MKVETDCKREDCKFQSLGSSVTCMGYIQTFDKNGKITSRDPNIRHARYNCITCGRSWGSRTQYGKTEYEELK